MKTAIRLSAIFVLVLVTLGQYSPALAGSFEKELYVTASFLTVDPSECIVTHINVSLIEINQPMATIVIWGDNTCTGLRLIDASGYVYLERSELQVAGNLDSASLNKKITVYDRVSQSSFDVSIDVTWTATTPLIRYVSNYLERRPSLDSGMCHWIEKQDYRKRDAQASGKVIVGEINYTPQPAVESEIFLGKYKDIYCRPMLEATLRAQLPNATRNLQSLKYSGVYAYFYQTDPSGCIDTYLEVGAGNFLFGPGEKLSGAALQLLKYDWCNRITVLNAYNDFIPLAASDFKISGNSAALSKMITLYDADQDKSIAIWVNLNWNASGPMNQILFTFQWHAPDCDEHVHETYGWREAQVSGKILSTEATFDSTQADYAEFYWDRYVAGGSDGWTGSCP